MNRLANKAYEACRAGKLTLSGFPDFNPHIQALKKETTIEQHKSYRVTCQVHDRLLLLDSLARKWLDESSTAESARTVVDEHNKEYNQQGDFMMDNRRGLKPNGPCVCVCVCVYRNQTDKKFQICKSHRTKHQPLVCQPMSIHQNCSNNWWVYKWSIYHIVLEFEHLLILLALGQDTIC